MEILDIRYHARALQVVAIGDSILSSYDIEIKKLHSREYISRSVKILLGYPPILLKSRYSAEEINEMLKHVSESIDLEAQSLYTAFL